MFPVAPLPVDSPRLPAATRAFSVKWNKVSLVTSLLMLLNIAAMPMKAYFSEEFPWQSDDGPVPVFGNLAADDPAYLALMQTLFNRVTLAGRPSFVYNATLRCDIFRGRLDLRHKRPVPLDDCVSFYYGTPGLMFYAPSLLDALCPLAATDHRNATWPDEMTWQSHGGCEVVMLLGVHLSQGCLWLDVGDDLNNGTSPPTPGVFTLTYAFQRPKYFKWLWFKFVYRLGLIAYVVWVTYARYYAHCVALRAILVANGHRVPRPSPDWSYELLIGDPTALVLSDPIVCTLFFVDIWLSTGVAGVALSRAMQVEDFYYTFLSLLYLSRMVWLAYLALCLLSKVLKRYHKENYFRELDKTLVAIGIFLSFIPFTYVQANTPMVHVYLWLSWLLPTKDPRTQIDVTLGGGLFTLLIANFPVIFGLVSQRFPRRHHRVATQRTRFASQTFNGFKARVILYLARYCAPKQRNVVESGGSIYAALAADACYKQCPTMGLRSVDCFLLCKRQGIPRHMIRLSLASSLDRNLLNPALAITEDTAKAGTTVFGHINSVALGPQSRTFTLQRGSVQSAWLA
ncbi:hypothetical protein SDRG_01915 [Saprolegnia diclina VS20]|uniref:Uncharacterized protein n=1 Tax=Saprolegnia diclina (strain VS20) TaxID=1156394 RepID=T0S6P8_SAPDV|nr:hypothetical protein SDRG_01915 [Saprolegnia diclina VS20]EQC40848.1 hypothetical protein SDRG_01915 [Saprolegnia diclina VS20]|eukprot:XP_008605692.1 hypothetical protein SDRG_01915 [Saprolegnia diclina VS20]